MDQMKLAMFLSGLVMFCLAPRLSRNALFFYLCGVIVGISTSLLLLFYLVHKMLPKSRLLYGLALGCSTLGIFVFHSIWLYVHSIIFEYSNQVLTYILVTGLVSFVMCYRMGPPTDPRSRNIIKWTIQKQAEFHALPPQLVPHAKRDNKTDSTHRPNWIKEKGLTTSL
uniref:Uncharacterized protein n=1 Tax=Timema shepardi TaxID=629360 RepID=A0A7R9G2R9_TIMSH|nr:unnamed protein product [Timema shepardi]